MFKGKYLSQDVDKQAGNGYQNGSGRDDGSGCVTDVGVLRLGLVRSDVQDVVLLQVEIGRQDKVALGQVEQHDFALAGSILTDQLHIVAYTVYGHIACHGEGFEHVYLFVAHGEGSRTVNFAQYGNLVVGHTYGHDRCFLKVGFQAFAYQVFCLVFGKSAHLEASQYGKVYLAVVVYQILLQRRLRGGIDIGQCRIQRSLYGQVERSCCLRVGSIYRDAEQVFRHDLGIVERNFLSVLVYGFRILQVRNVFVGGTSRQSCQKYQYQCECFEFHKINVCLQIFYSVIFPSAGQKSLSAFRVRTPVRTCASGLHKKASGVPFRKWFPSPAVRPGCGRR